MYIGRRRAIVSQFGEEALMSMRAEAYRQRALTVQRQFGASHDEAIAGTAAAIARSYEALAQTEEWLEGEVPPSVSQRAIPGSPASAPHP
jgi:hypothetical protein